MASKKESKKSASDIVSAAGEWKPDAENAGPSTFVQDPFGIRSTDIASDQASDEPLVLDEPLDEEEIDDDIGETEAAGGEENTEDDRPDEVLAPMDASILDRIHERVSEVTDRAKEELAALTAGEALTAAERLSAEIAEDEALARLMAEEAAGHDEVENQREAASMEGGADESAGDETQGADDSDHSAPAVSELDVDETQSAIEALLFISDRPVARDRLRTMLGEQVSAYRFQEAVDAMRSRYESPASGIELVEVAGGYQLRTKPGKAEFAKKLAKTQTQRLSSGALETLAIIAYKQPILKEEVDRIRGVDSSHFVRGLLEKGLVRMEGRSDLPGRPIIYATTPQFLELFGLRDLESMPPLHELESMIPTSEASRPENEEEDPKLRELRRLVGQMNSDPTRLIYDEREDDKFLSEIRARVKNAATTTPTLLEAELAAKAATANPVEAASPAIAETLDLVAAASDAQIAAKAAGMTDAI